MQKNCEHCEKNAEKYAIEMALFNDSIQKLIMI